MENRNMMSEYLLMYVLHSLPAIEGEIVESWGGAKPTVQNLNNRMRQDLAVHPDRCSSNYRFFEKVSIPVRTIEYSFTSNGDEK